MRIPYNIYGIVSPETNEIVYVGISFDVRERLKGHLWGHSMAGKKMRDWVIDIKNKGLRDKVNVVILQITYTKSSALKLERKWIEYYHKISPLLNGNKTGVKSAGKNQGLKAQIIHLSDETIVKLTVKGAKKKPRVTAKELIQHISNEYANRGN